MAKHQPEPFEYRHGRLLDNLGNPVDFKNSANLVLIGEAFAQLYAVHECIADDFNYLKSEFKNGPEVVRLVDNCAQNYAGRPL